MKLLFILICFYCNQVLAYITWITVLKNENIIYCYADQHKTFAPVLGWERLANTMQAKALTSIFDSCGPDYCFMTEDFSDYTGNNPLIHEFNESFVEPDKQKIRSPLIGSAALARSKGANVMSVAAGNILELVMPKMVAGLAIPESDIVRRVTTQDIVKEFAQEITDIKQYSDKGLSDYYANHLKKLEAETSQIISQMSKFSGSFVDFVDIHIRPESKRTFLYGFCRLFTRIMDMKTMHMISMLRNKKIILMMGAGHIYKLTCALTKLLSYQKLEIFGEEFRYKYPKISSQQDELDKLDGDQPIKIPLPGEFLCDVLFKSKTATT